MDVHAAELTKLCFQALARLGLACVEEQKDIPNGYCVVRREKRLYLNAALGPEEKALILLKVLSSLPLQDVYLPPLVRRALAAYSRGTLALHGGPQKPMSDRYRRSQPKAITIAQTHEFLAE